MIRARAKTIIAVGLLLSAVMHGGPWASEPSLPRAASQDPVEHPAIELLTGRCAICHSLDLVTQQRLSRDRWTSVVTKMVHWGAPLSPSEQAMLIEYLVQHYGDGAAP